MLLALLVTATSVWGQAPPKPFAAALQDVIQAPAFQATESEIRSIELDYASREIVLEPMLEASYLRHNENRQMLVPGALQQKPRYDAYGLTLSKPFSTGTNISVGPTYERALTPTIVGGRRDTMDWQISLSQNLWRDFFGRSTRLRRAREDFERRQDLAEALVKQGQLLYEFEGLYWDWAYSLQVAELQEKNVKRSREILRWVQDRFNRAAAESTDLLQARALLTQRELQVAAIKFSLTQVGTRIERFLPHRQWQPDPRDLSIPRKPEDLLVKWKPDELSRIEQLTFLQAENEARAEEERAKETREGIRPELALELAYGKNAIGTDGSETLRRSYRENHDYSSVGVVFRTGLDLGNERRKVESARATREAARQRRDAKVAENRVAWAQLKQELADMQTRVDRAHELVDLQIKKANAERERFRKGRSTAFQAITFEQEAAEAEITLVTLHSLMRKTEAQARLFAR